MNSAAFYQIAGLVLRINTSSACSHHGASLQPFETDEKRPDVCFHFHGIDPPRRAPSPSTRQQIENISRDFFCFNGHWNSSFLRSSRVLRHLAAYREERDWVSLELLDSSLALHDFKRGERFEFHPSDMVPDKSFILWGDRFIAPFLASFDAVIVHGAGVVRNERTALFLGADGAGKTTAATSQQSGVILSDDQMILRRNGNRFYAHGTPWGCKVDAIHSAPVGSFFLLEQAKEFELLEIKPEVALGYIWLEHLYYHFPLPAGLRLLAFNLVYELCRNIRVYRMRFPRDFVDWDAIDAVMKKSY